MIRQTSIEAFNQLKASGAITGRRLQVFEVLAKLGPMTAGELKEKMTEIIDTRAIDVASAHKRLTELRDSGLAQELGSRKCKVTGKMVIEWDVTGSSTPLARPIKNFTYQKNKDDLEKVRQSGRWEVVNAVTSVRQNLPYASWVLVSEAIAPFIFEGKQHGNK